MDNSDMTNNPEATNPSLVFIPAVSAPEHSSAAPPLVFMPLPLHGAAQTAQVAALNAQVAALNTQKTAQAAEIAAQAGQVAALNAQVQALTPSPLGKPFTNLTGRQVYAHFQMSCGVAGVSGNPPAADGTGQGVSLSVAGCAIAIREMRAMGFDGASLDIGALNFQGTQSVTNFFAGLALVNAENLVNGAVQVSDRAAGKFTAFLTFDCSGGGIEAPGVTSGFFLKYCHDPSYTTVTDKHGQVRPRFSTYGGGGGAWPAVKGIWAGEMAACRAAGVSPFFIAGFELTDAGGGSLPYTAATCTAYVQGLLVGLVDGYWNFGSQESPLLPSGDGQHQSPVLMQQTMAEAVKAAGLWCEGTVKCQVVYSNARFYNECYGPESLDAYTHLLLTPGSSDAHLFDSAQYVGANDYEEGTACSNLDPGPKGVWPYVFASQAQNQTDGYWKTKLGLQDLLGTFMQPFKSGQPLSYWRDDLYVAYICQMAAMVATNDTYGPYLYINTDSNPNPVPTLEDLFFIRLDLIAAATLVITQNGAAQSRFAPAGTSFHRVPKQAGAAQFAVVRGSAITVNVAGTPVAGPDNPTTLNIFNYTWHSGHSN